MKRRVRREVGFTLIELMITIVVLAILVSIAYPAYTEQVARGRRAQAQATLLMAQQWMERFYTENFRYDQNSAGTAVADLFNARFSTSPPPGEGTALYDLAVNAGSRESYTITATRKTGTGMANDKCGNFMVDQLGRKSIEGETYSSTEFASKAAAIAACWR